MKEKGRLKYCFFSPFSFKFPNISFTIMPWTLNGNWKMMNSYYFNPHSFHFCCSFSLFFSLSTAPTPILTPLLLASCSSDKILTGISRDIFHCLLITESLIKCSGPFPSQVHGSLPCTLGNQLPGSHALCDNMLKRPEQWNWRSVQLVLCVSCPGSTRKTNGRSLMGLWLHSSYE